MTIETGIAIFGVCYLLAYVVRLIEFRNKQNELDSIRGAIAQLGRRIEELERIIQ